MAQPPNQTSSASAKTAKRRKLPKSRLLPSLEYPRIDFSFEGPTFQDSTVAASESGRFALKMSNNWNENLILLDLYFNEKILFPNPDQKFHSCVALYDDLTAVVLRFACCLTWIRLDIENKAVVELFQSPEMVGLSEAFPLDSSGRVFMSWHIVELQIHRLERRLDAEGAQASGQTRSLPIDCNRIKSALISGDRLWIFAESDYWAVELANLPDPAAATLQFGELESKKSLDFQIHRIGILDAAHLIAIGSHPFLQICALRLDADGTANIVARRRLCPKTEWKLADSLICGPHQCSVLFVEKSPRSRRGDGWDIESVGKIGRIGVRRPESLLLIAHRAALESGKRFTLPLLEPVAPLNRYNPYRRFRF